MGIIVKDGVSYGGTGTVDPVLDQQSSNPVENKAVAKAISDINSALGGVSIVKCTQTEYDGMTSHDSNTLYIIIPDEEEEE